MVKHDNAAVERVAARNRKLAMVGAFLVFLIGWYHTGLGLANFDILGGKYGAFAIATVILIFMVIAYSSAVHGALRGLVIYGFLALITFACNLNSFYPSYRADALIRDELRDHRVRLGELKEWASSRFVDVEAKVLRAKSEKLSDEWVAQCKRHGTGPGTAEINRRLEDLLDTKITTLDYRSDEIEKCDDDYPKLAKAGLDSKLIKNKVLDRENVINDVNDIYTVYDNKIESSLKDKQPLKSVPNYVDQLVQDRTNICNQAAGILQENTTDKTQAATELINTPCSAGNTSPNKEIGGFSHTFRSIWSTLPDGGTILV